MASAIRNNVVMSQEELEQILEYQKIIGDLGEKLTLEHEIKRLTDNDKNNDLSDRVALISKVNSLAGYDISSYNDKNSDPLKFDRFIEVKSTTSLSPHFFWSRNEIQVAKKTL